MTLECYYELRGEKKEDFLYKVVYVLFTTDGDSG